MPSIAWADGVKFVASYHADPFEAAAIASTQSTKPTIAKMRLDEAGLAAEDSLFAVQAPMASTRTPSAEASADSFGASNSSNARPLANVTNAGDAVSNQSAVSDSTTVSQWGVSPSYSLEGVFVYGGALASLGVSGQLLNGTGSNPIDLGIGQSANKGDSNSSGVGDPRHNGVSPRLMWPIRILTGEPAPVPEPSSLLLLACGMLALGLKGKFQSAIRR